MIKLIRNYIGMIIMKQKNPTVIFKSGATTDMDTFFEGNNLLNKNVRIRKSYIGRGTYISGNTKLSYAKIGRFCSIGQNIKNNFGRHPTSEFVSTHPAFFSTKKQAGFTFVDRDLFEEHKFVDEEKKYLIEIGNDVWIGNNVSIMDGVKISDGAIIGMNAVVTKDVPPYAIVGGVPARIIKYRFNDDIVKKILDLKWWEMDFKLLKTNIFNYSIDSVCDRLTND